MHPMRSDSTLLEYARAVLRAEADAVAGAADRLDVAFARAVRVLADGRERVAVSGVGKSADIGQKIVGTLNSTGTRAYVLDATKAMHGDLGMVHPGDVALLLSHSGESEELVRLLPSLKRQAGAIVSITGNVNGSLAKASDAAVVYGMLVEACPNALAPSTTTTVMLALGDALAFTLAELRGFSAEDFARFHPAGSLGRKLARVEQVMRRGAELRIASTADTIRDVFARERPAGRRTGAIMLTDGHGRLAGLFTDSDLAKLFERRLDGSLDRPVGEVMTEHPVTIAPGARIGDAVELLRGRKISELPVVDADGRPVGMIDITDVIGLMGEEVIAEAPRLRLASA